MNNIFHDGLFILRHNITSYNASNIISGQSDIEIIDSWIDTSVLNLSNKQFRDLVIISSPSTRCKQTINCLTMQNSAICYDIHTDFRIIERSMGSWEGKLKTDILTKYPQYNYCGHINPTLTPPQGESFVDFTVRIDQFIQDLLAMSHDIPILICAHNQSLKLFKYRLMGYSNLLDFWVSCSFENGKIYRIF